MPIDRIPRCDEVNKAKRNKKHPCAEIVSYQKGNPEFQLPEPWSGHIDKAKVLFISSNPSIGNDPGYPTNKNNCNTAYIKNYFENRFSQPYYKSISFFKRCQKYTGWILQKQPGKIDDLDLCLTEVVHCKSKAEFGVKKCYSTCVGKWLNAVINRFNGDYIVVLGSVARTALSKYNFGSKIVITMPHPNARGVSDGDRKALVKDAIAKQMHKVCAP